MFGKKPNFTLKKCLLTLFILFLSSSLFAQHEHHMMSSTPQSTKSQSGDQKASKTPAKTSLPEKSTQSTFSPERTVDLVVSYKTVNFAGKQRLAIAVNNQIPAPTLHFKEGDHVTINVYNHLDKGTAIHWHGILVPWQMDGVEGVNQQPIPPGCVFHYRYTLHQAGTYWYHAHADVQEQDGLYGAFLIDPPSKPPYHYTKDYVVVLSDWDNMGGDKILKNLKKDGEYFSPRFPLQPSLAKFIHDYRKADSEEKKKLLEDYKMMQQMRMSIYDISDVAYDSYLLNGRTKCCPWTAPVKVGDVVRLRFIGAAGSTIYRIKIPNTKMEMVHVQGNDVKPHQINDFSIAPGETYDVLVKIEKNTPYIIYAESIDTRGIAVGGLLTDPHQTIDYKQVIPFPEPLPVTREMMANMMMSNMDHGSMKMGMSHHSMNMAHQSVENNTHSSDHTMQSMPSKEMENGPDHSGHSSHPKMSSSPSHAMSMPIEPTIVGDSISPVSQKTLDVTTIGTKYQHLSAAVKTNDPNKPIDGIIRMELFGYMERFIWFINGLPEYKAHPILIEPGKRYRIIFTNNSMMRHPMHIHGHWFILRNGQGAYDPLLHTIEVPPGATAVTDIDTDASGQWFFHCHHLYHMMTGMSRVFQYSTLIEIAKGEAQPQDVVKKTLYINRPIVRVDEARPIDISLVKHPMAHSMGMWLATYLDVGADPFNNVQRMTYKGLYGPDYNKLELFINDAEVHKGKVDNADMDVFYWHLISQFWAVKGGANYFYRPANSPYWQPGISIEGLMPYFIDTDLRGYFYGGSAKADLELTRDTQLTNNFFLRLGIRSILATKTVSSAAIGSGLNQMRYIIRPYYRLMPGLNLVAEFEHESTYGAFKRIQRNTGELTSENTLTFGISVLF